MQIIPESVKQFLNIKDKSGKDSSVVKDDNIINDLSAEPYQQSGVFFDSQAESNSGLFGKSAISETLFKQKDKLQKYRELAMSPDVIDGIDEIVNEVIFSFDDTLPIKIEMNEENDKLVDAVSESFQKIAKMMALKKNMYNIVKNGYVDGQLVMHTPYDKGSTKAGIKSIKMIEPMMLYYDKVDEKYKYMSKEKNILGNLTSEDQYDIEEIVIEDFGLKDGKVNLSYLEYAIKPANMLKTLEDLLVPLRFSRSISRRVFNVDIGDLPSKRGAEVMNEHQSKFKYKKFYNNTTGEVTNQQHITSMVEDYWFANRSGGKGTTVDVMDETGNLGELNDILYFSKKLYRAMKIPSNRINSNPDADSEFDYDSTRVSKEDVKFFMFISRVRQVYSSMFKELLRREVISTQIMTPSEWEEKEEDIRIIFINENQFIEQMKLSNFMQKLDIYSTAAEYQGKLFSVEKILKDIFRLSEDEIKDELKAIEKESKDKLYANFYKEDEDGF